MKQQYHKPSNDASQTYDRKRRVRIIFCDSPFFGQEAEILKEMLGRHSDLRLELLSGKRIRMDAAWTDYFGVEPCHKPSVPTHCVDLAQAQPIIQFIAYLRGKQKAGDPSLATTNAEENPKNRASVSHVA